MEKLLGNKLLIIGGSLVVLLALGVVLGLAIVRVQNPAPTVTQPKAAGNTSWPACAKEGPFAYQGSLSDLDCCNKIPTQGSDACPWPQRGWCKPSQCSAGIDIPNNCSSCSPGKDCTQTGGGKGCLDSDGKCQNISRGCRCGLYYQDSTSTCQQSCSAAWECFSLGASYDCINGSCVDTKNPCWVPEPVPQNFVFDSSTQTLSWAYNTTWSSNIKYAIAYVWTSSSKAGNAVSSAGAKATDGYKSVKVSDFKPALQTNTTYYLGVNVNGYASPKPGQYDCMGDAEKGWQFTTGAGTACTGSTPDLCGSTCTNTKTDSNNCGACGTVCPSGKTCSNGVCTTSTACQMNADCPAGQVCVNGTCTGQTSQKSVGGCKALEGTVCSTPSNAIFTLSTSPVYLDSVAATQLAASGEPNSFLFNPTPGQHSLSVTPPTGYTVSSYTICDANANCQFDIPGSGPVTVTTPTTSGLASVNWHFTATGGGGGGGGGGQVNACWGNGGTDGKCYDCNGDGEVNILDFSCFRNKYLQNVQ